LDHTKKRSSGKNGSVKKTFYWIKKKRKGVWEGGMAA
jgi:hypothetical protein